MFTLRCLHPPSGAVALTAVLGGPAVASLGYGRAVAGGAELRDPAVHRRGLTARCATNYPRRHAEASRLASDARPRAQRAPGVSRADLDQALSQRGELLDISKKKTWKTS